jgi:chemotaxis protein CheD
MSAGSDCIAKTTYFDRDFNVQATKLLPGEYYTTNEDTLIVTTLGSCVSACIRDPLMGVGGMNHFMLPEAGGAKDGGVLSHSARYGTFAMEVLINNLLKLGGRRAHLEAKVFGGGNVLAGMTLTNVGERNAVFVQEFLQSEGIRIVAKDLIDVYPRKVYYFPKTGKVMVRKLRNLHNHTILERETDYRSNLKQSSSQGGEVELFG